jgi:hypothetical protein
MADGPPPPTPRSRKRPREEEPPPKSTSKGAVRKKSGVGQYLKSIAPDAKSASVKLPLFDAAIARDMTEYSDTFGELFEQMACKDTLGKVAKIEKTAPPKPLFVPVRTALGSTSCGSSEWWPGFTLGIWPPARQLPTVSTTMPPPPARVTPDMQRSQNMRTAIRLYGPALPNARPKQWPLMFAWFADCAAAYREDRPVHKPLMCVVGPGGVGKTFSIRWLAHAHEVTVIDFELRAEEDMKKPAKSKTNTEKDANERMESRLRTAATQMIQRPTVLHIRDLGSSGLALAVRIGNIAASLANRKRSCSIIISMAEVDAFSRAAGTGNTKRGPPTIYRALHESPFCEWIVLYRPYASASESLAKQWITAARPYVDTIRTAPTATWKHFYERVMPQIAADARGDFRQVMLRLTWHLMVPLETKNHASESADDNNKIETALDVAQYLHAKQPHCTGHQKASEVMDTLGNDGVRQVVEFYMSWIRIASGDKDNLLFQKRWGSRKATAAALYIMMLDAKRKETESRLDPGAPEQYLISLRHNIRLHPLIIGSWFGTRNTYQYISLVEDAIDENENESAEMKEDTKEKPSKSLTTVEISGSMEACSQLLDTLSDVDILSSANVEEADETSVARAVYTMRGVNFKQPSFAESLRWLHPRYKGLPYMVSTYPTPPNESGTKGDRGKS